MNNNDSDEEEKPEEPLPENRKRYSDMKNEHYKEVVKSKLVSFDIHGLFFIKNIYILK